MLNVINKLSLFILGFIFASILFLSTDFISSVSAERQPLMYGALENLNQAEWKLENASPDKGGHRVKALDLVRAAKVQVKKGIKFDNRY